MLFKCILYVLTALHLQLFFLHCFLFRFVDWYIYFRFKINIISILSVEAVKDCLCSVNSWKSLNVNHLINWVQRPNKLVLTDWPVSGIQSYIWRIPTKNDDPQVQQFAMLSLLFCTAATTTRPRAVVYDNAITLYLYKMTHACLKQTNGPESNKWWQLYQASKHMIQI